MSPAGVWSGPLREEVVEGVDERGDRGCTDTKSRKVMKPICVRIGQRFFHLHAMRRAHIEEYAGAQSLVLVYRAHQESRHESLRLGGAPAQQMISILEPYNLEPS